MIFRATNIVALLSFYRYGKFGLKGISHPTYEIDYNIKGQGLVED